MDAKSTPGRSLRSVKPVKPVRLEEPSRPGHRTWPAQAASSTAAAGALPQYLLHMLNEVDYGMLVLDREGQLLHLNLAAMQQLDASHPLQLTSQGLRTRLPAQAPELARALAACAKGVRKLITLGQGEQRASVAVVPLADGAGSATATLLMLGRPRASQQLAVQSFATAFAITRAETRVLAGLCAGVQPSEIARRGAVKLSTVRAQINSLRIKCGVSSIRELVQQVAMLPPLLQAAHSKPALQQLHMHNTLGLRLPRHAA